MNKIYVAYWGDDNAELISAPTVQDAKRIIAKARNIDSHEYAYFLRVRLVANGERLYSPEDGRCLIIGEPKPIETSEPDGVMNWEATCAKIRESHNFTWGY